MRYKLLLISIIVLVPIEIFFGPGRLCYYFLFSGPLGESGQRYKYFLEYSDAGLLGKLTARKSCFDKFKLKNRGYNFHQFLFRKSIWKNLTNDYFKRNMPSSDINLNTMLGWIVHEQKFSDVEHYKTYLIIEFSNDGIFKAIGINGKTPSDDIDINKNFNLSENYDHLNKL